jgi:hypothetical protein
MSLRKQLSSAPNRPVAMLRPRYRSIPLKVLSPHMIEKFEHIRVLISSHPRTPIPVLTALQEVRTQPGMFCRVLMLMPYERLCASIGKSNAVLARRISTLQNNNLIVL